MTWMTIGWPLVIGACVTMGSIQLWVGIRRTSGGAHLLFTLNVFVVAVYAGCEMALACADSPARYLASLRWLDIMAGLQVATTAAFVWVFFGTGRKWLALLASGLSCGALIADFLPEPKLVYLQLTGIRKIPTFGGATYTVADGVENPLNALFYLGVFLLVVFVADASVTLWRRGAHRRAAVVGGAITFFVLAGGTQAALVDNGILRTPYLLSYAYLAILVAMGMELSHDVLHAAQLAHDLRESEARMSLATVASGLRLWEWDMARDEIWAIDRTQTHSGPARFEHRGFDQFLQSVHPDDREPISHAVAKSMNGDGELEVEYRVLRPNGAVRWQVSRGRVEFNAAGKPVRMRGISLDISERKQSELELAQQRNELAHIARVSTMGELAASLAHELNQPLGAILSNAEAAELFLQQDPPPLHEVREILAEIRKDDQRAGDIIHRMHTLLRKHELALVPLNLNELVQDVLELVSVDADLRKTTIRADLMPDLPPILGDRVHLQQVLLNLILNAMDAVAREPEELRKLVVRTARNQAGEVEAAVIDSGPGIAPDDLPRLFEAFYTTKPKGMGMGLSIARRIIKTHGGRLWAENNAAGGATFRFTLPAAPDPQKT
jgi:two-component system, LuxR family, sensor kinase FixL